MSITWIKQSEKSVAIVAEAIIIPPHSTADLSSAPSIRRKPHQRPAAGVFFGGFVALFRENSKMNGLRGFVIRFFSVAIAALALMSGPAMGAEKRYTLTVSPASPMASSGPFVFTFTNDGNSSFNSLSLTVPTGWSIPATASVTASRGNVTLNAARTQITVNDINLPTGAGQSMFVTVSAVTGTATCAQQSGTWSAQPWTGSSVGSGQTFQLKNGTSFPSTTLLACSFTVTGSPAANVTPTPQTKSYNETATFTVTAPAGSHTTGASGCGGSLAGSTFTTGPITANCTVTASFAPNTMTVVTPDPVYADGNPFNVSVTLEGPIVPVSLGSTCPGFTITGSSESGSTTTFTAKVTAVPAGGSCSVSASAADYPTTLKSFTVFGGTLGCTSTTNKGGNLDPGLDLAYVNVPPDWGLIRGNNKDGGDCVVVPYTFTLDTTVTPQKASFIVPPGTGQAVSAQYIVVWKAITVLSAADPNAFWTIVRPKLAWKTDSSGNPIYIPALSCVVDPDDFSLVKNVIYTGGPPYTFEDLKPTIPNTADFTPTAATYPIGSKANMCISQLGWTSVGKDSSGNTLVQYWTKVIDLGDGFMSLD
ncbi:MAG: hypothetical protein IT520_10365 [Burkholderiales bacterium]|nr:hypothetical protein [Burkholderiales bacterium]